jgi:hypothetical protein
MSAQQHEPGWTLAATTPGAYPPVLTPAPAQATDDDFSDLDDLASFEPGWPDAEPRPVSADAVAEDEPDGSQPDQPAAVDASAPAAPQAPEAAEAPEAAQAPEEAARPAAAPPLKSGVRTTEFWQTVLTQLLAIGVSVATLFGANVDSSTLQTLVPAVALLASAGASAYYSAARSKVKSAHASTGIPPNAGA